MKFKKSGQATIEALLIGVPFLLLMVWFVILLIKFNVSLLAEFNNSNLQFTMSKPQ